VRLVVLHPGVAAVDCHDCQRWLHNQDWKPVEKRGRKVPRHGPPPCRTCPKIEKGVEPRPENATRLTPEFWETWRHYHESAAVGWQTPDALDPLVRRNAAVIRGVLDAAERVRHDSTQQLILAALAGAATRKAGR
jgi:hypothetical protein